MLVIAVAAGFLASTVALRARLSAADTTGGGEIGSDLGLWAGLRRGRAGEPVAVDPWALSLLALGARGGGAGAGRAAGRRGRGRRRRRRRASRADRVRALAAARSAARGAGSLGAAIEHPALVAVPAGDFVLWLGRRVRA